MLILGQLFDSSVYYPLDMHDLMLNLLPHVGHNQFLMWMLTGKAQNSICKRHNLFGFQRLQLTTLPGSSSGGVFILCTIQGGILISLLFENGERLDSYVITNFTIGSDLRLAYV